MVSSSDAETWRRPGPTGAERRHDLWIGAGMFGGALFSLLLMTSMGAVGDRAPSLAEQVLWAAAMTLPLGLRRRWPEVVILLVAVAMIGAQARAAAGDNQFASIAVFLAIYTLGAWGRDRTLARWIRAGVILAMFAWLGISMTFNLAIDPATLPGDGGPLDPVLAAALWQVGFNLMFFLSAYYFGNVGWEAARQRHELAEQAEELRRSQEENARQAVVGERVRIARDLHDVVAHNVSVMGIQAAAARRVLDSDRELAGRCLQTVEDTARSAVTELRSLLGVLRSEGVESDKGAGGGAEDAPAAAYEPTDSDRPEHASAPGLDQLPELVAETESSGLTARFHTFGEPRAVPESTALSVYRVAQEALTNTVKHAAATSVDVRLRYRASSLELEVADDGRGVRAPLRTATRAYASVGPARTEPEPPVAMPAGAAADGSRPTAEPRGFGLVGMRERVAVHGGELEAGSRRSGGFRVRASFPLGGTA